MSRSTPVPAIATVPQQGAFSAPPSLAVCSHKEVVDYLTILTVNEKTCKMELESLRDIMYGSYLENPL